jgi:formyltetrahydrofolate deformylase
MPADYSHAAALTGALPAATLDTHHRRLHDYAMQTAVFLIQCPDQKGLVSRISTFFYERGFNIVHCQQHTDVSTTRYYMRLVIDLADLRTSRQQLEDEFASFGVPLQLDWSVHYSEPRARVGILVTRASHCLYDLLVRQNEGELRCEIPVVIANRPDLEPVARQFRVPFHCLPVTAATKPEQEAKVQDLLRQHHVDLVVMARYMQILSPEFVEAWAGRVINIHHAFLPGFKGARPYHQAYDRGVKMIGATAHYATSDLDEGPIIEQDVVRVTHEDTPEELSRIGSDIERIVLARAVKAHLEHRIIVAGRRTIVFS